MTENDIMEIKESDIVPEKTKKEAKKNNIPESVSLKRGVCYLSILPPRMDDHILRKILSKRFEIERIYLEKENQAITRSR